MSQRTDQDLALGPMLRHVDATSASIWVETARSCTVEVGCSESSWPAPTFAAHGHHYALVEVSGLEVGSVNHSSLHLQGNAIWPHEDGFPEWIIATIDLAKNPRLAFGSCRNSVPHDAVGNRKHGVEAMCAYVLSMAGPAHGPWLDVTGD